MSQHYSNPDRETEATALPDVETFRANYAYCDSCGSLIFYDHFTRDDGALCGRCECGHNQELNLRGWFYWFCFPGCLPDSEPMGPYATEAEAIADAQSAD